MTTPTTGAADLPEALINIAREIEALKRNCGPDPESAVAVQNGCYMALSYKVRALAAQAISAEPAGAGYAELPEDAYRVHAEGLRMFDAAQMRDFADCTHALRASRRQAPAQPNSTEGDVFRALIEFLLHADDALAFLRCWNEGNFGACRLEWPEAPPYLYPDTAPTPTHQAADTGAAAPLLDYAMQIAHERELRVTGNPHDEDGAKLRFEAAAMRHIATGAAQPDSVLEDAADPLQGAANWLAEAHGQFCVVVLQGCLMIGYNRAKRLHDVAIAARKQGEKQ